MGVAISDHAASLQSSRDQLFSAIRGLTEEQFRFLPPGESWCIAAHLAHLLRIERVYTERAFAAVDEDEPFVKSTRVHNDDDPGAAQHLAVPQIVHGLLNVRRELTSLLDEAGPTGMLRAIRHETLGRMTIGEIATKMATHEGEHAAAILKLVKQAPVSARLAPPAAHVIIPLVARS